MVRFFLVFAMSTLCTLCQPAAAQGIYKCSSAGGKVSYGDRPCVEGAGKRLPPVDAGVSPPEASAVATRDARTLLALEKLRMAREKDEARERNAQARQARAAGARRKTCDKLRLRHKWAAEDLARANGTSREPARLKVRRQAETLAVECPA
jgi:hypothetical protein